MRLISVLLAILLANPAAIAEENLAEETPKPRRYTVEVIIFTYEENVSVGTEIFPPDEPPPAEDELLFEDREMGPDGIAIDADGEPVPVFSDSSSIDTPADEDAAEESPELLAIEPVLMIDDEFSLQRALEKLQLLDAYRPIMHTGWTQTTLPLEESTALELSYFGEPPAGLEGSFMLYLGRYLHLVVDVSLGAVTDGQDTGQADEPILMFGDEAVQYDIGLAQVDGDVFYRIQEDRIVKNGDVRYFDHPRFGVIAKVTRVEEPEEDPETDTDADSAALVASPVQ